MDMPYDNAAVGLFDCAHSLPKEHAWEVLEGTIRCLESVLYSRNVRKAEEDVLRNYIVSKAERNISRITKARHVRALLGYEEILINGVPYKNLPYYYPYLARDHLI